MVNGKFFTHSMEIAISNQFDNSIAIVHGRLRPVSDIFRRIIGCNFNYPLAWVENIGKVFILGYEGIWTLEDFVESFKPFNTSRYSTSRAVRLRSVFGNDGPWYYDDGTKILDIDESDTQVG